MGQFPSSPSRPMSPTPSGSYGHHHTLSGRASSPSSSIRNNLTAAFQDAASELDPVPVILSRGELRRSIEDYENLLSSAKVYRNQMIQLATAAANFGCALERMARNRGAVESGQGLQAAAGLQLLISNHQQLLSDTFYKSFEIPLLENFDNHKNSIYQSEENYDRATREISEKIKSTEAKNLMSGRKGQRDLSQFRQALQDLTRQVDELERIKTDFHRHMLDTEQHNFNLILAKAGGVVRAEVDVYERIANKGMADPVLEQMLTTGPDPFCTYTTSDESSEIFTVLPATSLISPTPQHPHHLSSPRDVTQAALLPQAYALTETTAVSSALGDFVDISYAYGYTRDSSNANAEAYLRDSFLKVDVVGSQGGLVSAAVEETPLGRGGFVTKTTTATTTTTTTTTMVEDGLSADMADISQLEIGRKVSIVEEDEESTPAIAEKVEIQESTAATDKQRMRSESDDASKLTESEEDLDTDEDSLLNSFTRRTGTKSGSDPNPLRSLQIGSEVFNDRDFSFGDAEVEAEEETFKGGAADSGYSAFEEKREQVERKVEAQPNVFGGGAFEQIVV